MSRAYGSLHALFSSVIVYNMMYPRTGAGNVAVWGTATKTAAERFETATAR